MSILIVDDDHGTREAVAAILQDAGYCALKAASAMQAVNVLSENPYAIGLVLLDLMMPTIDGWELAEMIDDAVPIVAMTALGGVPLPPNAMAWLKKPFHLDDLLQAVRIHYDAARHQPFRWS